MCCFAWITDTFQLQVAPEILHAGPNEPYQSNVDVYSVGCVAYTLLCGYEPFYGQTDAALIAANKAVRSVRVSVLITHMPVMHTSSVKLSFVDSTVLLC